MLFIYLLPHFQLLHLGGGGGGGGVVTTFSPICVQPGITIGGVTFEGADTIV